MEPEAKADDTKIIKTKGRPKREATKDLTEPKPKTIKPKAEPKQKVIKPKPIKAEASTAPLTTKPKKLQNKKLPIDPETERKFKIFLNAETKYRNALLHIR
jgi:hypothetical protein